MVIGLRRDLADDRRRLDAVDRRVIDTDDGSLEYTEQGTEDAVVVSQGIFHGCDGGVLSVRDLVEGHRIIVPARFGYLGSDAGIVQFDDKDMRLTGGERDAWPRRCAWPRDPWPGGAPGRGSMRFCGDLSAEIEATKALGVGGQDDG